MLHIDHVFVFATRPHQAAEQLIDGGFCESPGRAHRGQGTENRKFHFGSFFLEILWVRDTAELQSEQVRRSGLARRALGQAHGVSPYGLCFVNTAATDDLFKDSIRYQPEYFPEGQVIDVRDDEDAPHVPWFFRLPFRKGEPEVAEARVHPNGAEVVTGIAIRCDGPLRDKWLKLPSCEPLLALKADSKNSLHIDCDGQRQGRQITIGSIGLTLRY